MYVPAPAVYSQLLLRRQLAIPVLGTGCIWAWLYLEGTAEGQFLFAAIHTGEQLALITAMPMTANKTATRGSVTLCMLQGSVGSQT